MSGAPGPGADPTRSSPRAATDTRAYLLANRARFTDDALTHELLRAGHDQASIDQAWTEIREADRRAGRADRRSTVAIGILVAYAATWLLFTLGWIGRGQSYELPSASVILGVALLIPALFGFFLARGSGRLRSASLGTAAALSLVPLVVLIGIAGVCAAFVPPVGPRV
jgi:hypothetical protein